MQQILRGSLQILSWLKTENTFDTHANINNRWREFIQ